MPADTCSSRKHRLSSSMVSPSSVRLPAPPLVIPAASVPPVTSASSESSESSGSSTVSAASFELSSVPTSTPAGLSSADSESSPQATTPVTSASANRSFRRSEEHTSELQSLMRISYAVFCLKQKTSNNNVKHKTNDEKQN